MLRPNGGSRYSSDHLILPTCSNHTYPRSPTRFFPVKNRHRNPQRQSEKGTPIEPGLEGNSDRPPRFCTESAPALGNPDRPRSSLEMVSRRSSQKQPPRELN